VHLGRHWNWIKGVTIRLHRQAIPIVFWTLVVVACLAVVSFGGVWVPAYITVITAATVRLRRVIE
jgi:hypothetical protein